MIALLMGTINALEINATILNVNGVGYEVLCPQSTLAKLSLNQNATLHIHTHVREDQLSLFGFLEKPDRDLFRLLISVSGVGPKIALTLLSHHNCNEIRNAIATAQINIFTQTPGIGKKVAQKIIVDLKSKIGSLAELDLSETNTNSELISALQALGYKPQELTTIIHQVPPELTTLESQIKFVLKQL